MKQYFEEIVTLLRDIKLLLTQQAMKTLNPSIVGREDAERHYVLGYDTATIPKDRSDFASDIDFEAYVESFNKTFEELSVNDLVDEPDWLT